MRTPHLLPLALLACAPPNPARPYPTTEPPAGDAGAAPSSGVVRYFDRGVDLRPFLAGFPYEHWMPSLRTGRLFFLHTGERYTLEMLDISGDQPRSLDRAAPISDVDWSQRSLWDVHHHAATDTLWLHADARNDERMNLWTLNIKTGALDQVTDHDYVYGLGFRDDDTQLAYLPRDGRAAPYRSCLRVMDVATRAAREVVCDSPVLSYTWSSPRFTPDGKEVLFNAQQDGDRNRVQIVAVDLTAERPTARVLTDPKVARTDAELLEGWVDGDLALFLANDDGFRNLYSLSRRTGAVKQLTRFTEDLTSAALTEAGVVGVHRSPLGSTLVVIDPRTGKVTDQRAQRGTADVLDGHDGRALWVHEAPDLPFELQVTTVGAGPRGGQLGRGWGFGVGDELTAALVRCRAEAVEIPTFDRDRATGKPRELHAFVLTPREPLTDPAQRLALIESFYGGENRYSAFEHILCAVGLTVVSPAVRGSDGFGKAFAALNDRDLGGDEIVDLFHVARWTERALGLTSRQIGVFGASHGGYATMRALTFPPETNGRGESYPFGFGLAHAGFSDIARFHAACNIPDWVVLESGDPARPDDLARMRDRSPLTHVDRLQASLLLTHGAADWRVPVVESRSFAEKARALGKPVTYVEFPGQGHHIEGLARVTELYQARFDFLQKVAAGRAP